MRILHLDDDGFILELARHWLEDAGHHVTSCESGAAAIAALQREPHDLAVLDARVPDVPGEEVLRWIRTHHPRMPVVFATSTDDEAEVARVLTLGADDYLVKPLRPIEFLARVTAAARRAGLVERDESIREGAYVIQPRERAVSVAGEAVRLTPRLFDLAHLLFARRGELLTRQQIYLQVWGQADGAENRTIDTHVSRLREVLQLDGRHGWRLTSVYKHGYRLEPTG